MMPSEILLKVLPEKNRNLNQHLATPTNFNGGNAYVSKYFSNLYRINILTNLYNQIEVVANQLIMAREEIKDNNGNTVMIKYVPNEIIPQEEMDAFVQLCQTNNDIISRDMTVNEIYTQLKNNIFVKNILFEQILVPLTKNNAEKIYSEIEKKFAIAPLFSLDTQNKGKNYVKCSLTTNELRNNNLDNLAHILSKMKKDNVLITIIGKITQLTVPTILIQANVGKNRYIYFANSYGVTTIQQDRHKCEHYPYMKDITNENIDYLSKYIINVMRYFSSVDDKLVKIMELAMSNNPQEKLRNNRFNELTIKNTKLNKYSFSSYYGIAPCITVSNGKLLLHDNTVIIVSTNSSAPSSFVKSTLNYSDREHELLYKTINKILAIPVEDIKLIFTYYRLAHDLRRKI